MKNTNRYILLLLIFLGVNFSETLAQGESLTLSVTFDESDSLMQQLNIITEEHILRTEGANKKGVQLKSAVPLNLSEITQIKPDFSLLFWFQLNTDARTKQTLFFAQDSLSFFTVFIKDGALSVQYTTTENRVVSHHTFLPSLNTNQWQMLGVSVNHCQLSVSVGCEILIEEQLNSSLFERRNQPKNIFVGSDNISTNFKGNIDELMLFKRPLSPIQFRWFCSKNFLGTYLPIRNENEANSTEPQIGLNNTEVDFTDSAILGVRESNLQPQELLANGDEINVIQNRNHPISFSHFTLQLNVFLESLNQQRQRLLEFKAIEENRTFTIYTKQDSLRLDFIENGVVQSVNIYANLKVLQQNQITIEFECCKLKVYNHCDLQVVRQLQNLSFNKESESFSISLNEKSTITKIHYMPYIIYSLEKASFICGNSQVESFTIAKESAQNAIIGLFDTRKSYLQQEPVEVTTKQVLLSFWDFDRIDGDTVSALFNDELILQYHGLTAEKITKMVELEEGKENTLKLYAHSDGSEGTNTVKVGILSGGGYYQEVDISTEALLNGGIILKYKPE